MTLLTTCFFVTLCFQFNTAAVGTKGSNELLFVQIVWRHGDRSPVSIYPTDPNQSEAWPHGLGELTETGMIQQYTLGNLIRQRYINGTYSFLVPNYLPKEIYVRSTDVNRTLISAMANLAGMYPTGIPGTDYPRTENGSWPSNWTPIPVHTVEFDHDYIGNAFAFCPRSEQIMAEIRASRNYRMVEEENKDFFKFLTVQTGMKVNLDNVELIYDTHIIEKIHNLTQPAWLTKDVAAKLHNLTHIGNEFILGISEPYVPELIKLRGGSLLKTLHRNMFLKLQCLKENAKKECEWIRNLKYFALSAHDTTIAALLSTFGDEEEVIVGGIPHYTASVAIELWNRNDVGPAIKILYHSDFHHKYRPVTNLTKGCPHDSDFCPFSVFEERSLKFIPQDINMECKLKDRKKRKIVRNNRTRFRPSFVPYFI
ncbi:hypothetical protein AB6A40_002331 [Gnathostoma spinigerum]|uniref:Acid phosphatase n=1 Tax=Gnathostoma spinigerum TaxID=75299 RepID=A0ABD6EGE3_9BILA